MRTRSIVVAIIVIIIIGVIALAAVRLWGPNQTMVQAPAASATPMPSETPSQEALASPTESESPAITPTPALTSTPALMPTPALTSTPALTLTPTPTPTAMPTIPTPPPGLPAGWEQQVERTVGGREADLVVRTGSIDNLGFGWPPHFTPFSGKETPPHAWLCQPRPGAAPGTDRNMLGTGVTTQDLQTRRADGYSGCSKRPDNLPQAIPLVVGTLPNTIHRVFFQMFLDDFQPISFHSHFQVTLNGTRIPQFEDTINQLDQTGPIGKLVTLPLLPEYWPILRTGTVNLYIDDPSTGAPDGYAIDFVRILVNPRPFRYAVTITSTVVDASTQKPIAGASVSAAQITASTSATGTCALRGVPAGLVSVGASAVGYDSQVQLLDLPAGSHGVANFTLHRHTEGIADLKREIQQNGSVAIYGIHFDTASAKLRPDSLPSLKTILQLVESSPSSRWIISGHTDNQGGAAYNLGLSLARAHSVVTWLTEHGIGATRLTAKGYGLTRPIADNATASGRALNRRVEVSPLK